MLKQFEELKIFIEDYLSYLRESKQVRKQIRIHYKDDLHKFILTFLYGVSCWFLFFIGGKIIVHFDFVNLGIISIMFALLYSFVIFTPLSLIFLLRYSTNVRIAQKVFENEWRANKIIKKLQTTRDRDRIQHFQRLLRKFDYNFYYMIWGYFKGYGKRIKTYSIILTECYSRFDTVLNMVCINVEINSNKAREMLSDFSKYMDEIRSKILVPLIQDKLQISRVTALRLLSSGRLRGQKIGRRWWVNEEDFIAFLERKE